MIEEGRSYRFSHALCRRPGKSVSNGLRAADRGDPDPAAFEAEHKEYVAALEKAGIRTTVLEPQEAFPDSVFIEDAALCVGAAAIALRPGAPTRAGEPEALRPDLTRLFGTVLDLPADGRVDGGDVLLTDTEALVGLSERTDQAGLEALAAVLSDFALSTRAVHTPPGVLHFKSDCGLLDSETIFATARLAAGGCFSGYRVLQTPAGEEAAANLIRVNDVVFLSAGHPKTAELLDRHGYRAVVLPTSEAAKVDGGLSCMSLRYARTEPA